MSTIALTLNDSSGSSTGVRKHANGTVTLKRRVNKARKSRSVNLAQRTIPLSVDRRVNEIRPHHCILHKYINGYILVELNKYGSPVSAYTNTNGIFPILAKYVSDGSFTKRLLAIRPHTLYANDGEMLRDAYASLADARIVTYTCDLYALLERLRSELSESERGDASCEARSGVSTSGGGGEATQSFEFYRSLDPTLTRKEYRRLLLLAGERAT